MSKYLRAHGKPWIERVLTPSLSIIYPLTQKTLEKVFFYSFHPFLCWIKEKSAASLAYRDICEYKMQNQYYIVGSATVSQDDFFVFRQSFEGFLLKLEIVLERYGSYFKQNFN